MLQLSLLSPETSLGGVPSPDYGGYLLVCAGLVVSLGLLAYGFRRLCGGALKKRAAKRSMSVIDVLPLGGRHKLAVVRCYDRTFVLGIAEKAISLVAEIEREEGEFEFPPRTADNFDGELLTAGAPAPAKPPKTPIPSNPPKPPAPRASAADLVAKMREEGVLG